MKIMDGLKKEDVQLIKYRLKGVEPLNVVAGLIEKDGKYLIGKRLYGDETSIGKWEFPGGKIETNEEETAAIEREIKEEFNLNIKADRFVASVIHEYPKRVINLKLWHGNVVDDSFSMDEKDHDAYKWVTLEEIASYELCPADQELYDKIKA